MKTCPQCRRHLFASDERCPFCGCEQRETSSTAASASLLGLMIAAVSCGPAIDDNPADSASSDSAATSSGGTSGSTGAGSTAESASASGPATTAPGTSTGPDETTSGHGFSTGSSTDDGMTTATSIGSASVGFLYGSPDGGSSTPFECSQLEQNCGEGEKCSAWANDGGNTLNAAKCVPVDPDADSIGEPCIYEGSLLSGVDSCELGARCMGEAGGIVNEGICVPLCVGSDENPICDDPNLECVPTEMEAAHFCIAPCECEGKSSCVASIEGQGECVPAP